MSEFSALLKVNGVAGEERERSVEIYEEMRNCCVSGVVLWIKCV
jgi:hypothetical protein